MMKTLNKSWKRAINCGDGRFLAPAAVLAFVCLLVVFVLFFVFSVIELLVEVVGEAEILAG